MSSGYVLEPLKLRANPSESRPGKLGAHRSRVIYARTMLGVTSVSQTPHRPSKIEGKVRLVGMQTQNLPRPRWYNANHSAQTACVLIRFRALVEYTEHTEYEFSI